MSAIFLLSPKTTRVDPGFFKEEVVSMRVKFSPSGIPDLGALRQQFPESYFIIMLNPAYDP